MFGDEHLGRAVALRREFRGMTQLALARAIGVSKATMNGYERGSRGMDASTLERISMVLECQAIEIWEDGFKIFRYNHLREQAERMGINVNDLIDRLYPQTSLEQVREAFQTTEGKIWELVANFVNALKSDNNFGSRSGVPQWGVVVSSKTNGKRERVVRFRKKKKSNPKTKSRFSEE
jgi:transcriptional regulator with XRE-family HTH domain